MVVLAFTFEALLVALVWAALVLLNIWVFGKTKAQGNLLMLVGGGLLALSALIWAFSTTLSSFVVYWMPLIGAVLVVLGFYFTVKPMVEGNILALKKKLREVTGEKPAEKGEETGEGPGA